MAATLRELRPASAGVGIIALDHPVVREAIREAAANGLPVLTMVSDVANVPRVGYVGIDNRAAGRLAGHLLGRFVPGSAGEVALFAGSLRYRGHEEREMGFRTSSPTSSRSCASSSCARSATSSAATTKPGPAGRAPGLRGLYNIGAGNRGIARALEEAGRGSEVVFIGHEITEHAPVPARRHDGRCDRPEPAGRGARGRRPPAAGGARPADPDPAAVRIHAIFRENMPEV